jgi:hypothetical protein
MSKEKVSKEVMDRVDAIFETANGNKKTIRISGFCI